MTRVAELPELFHAYDPQKAHEYYLRTRKLKGRKAGSITSTAPADPSTKTYYSKKAFNKASGETEQAKSAEQTSEQRLKAMRERLARLEAELRKRVEAAKARNGPANAPSKSSSSSSSSKTEKSSSTESSTSSKSSKSGSSSSKTKELTATQKREKAKADAKRYEKEKKEKPVYVEDQIENVQEQIREVLAKLKEATARAREQAKSTQTAPKGR